MARRLAARGPLVVWNRTASVAHAFASETGARVADTAAAAARGADVVFTCFPSSHELREVLDGADGLRAGLEAGSLLVDCTSGDPDSSRRIAAELAERDVAFLDAPVSGGTSGAEKGTLTVMVGGDREVLERARPILAAFAGKIVHCGGVGTGVAVKAVNNALLAVHVWATGEGLVALAKMGVDPAVALEVVNGSSGRSNASMNLFPERVLTGAFPRTFRLALLDKDAAIAADLARALRVPAPMFQLAAELFRLAHAELGEEADHVEAVRLIERWAGVDARAAGATSPSGPSDPPARSRSR